eukprot:SAG22_NODE_18586_length_284_cov_1.616216_1_plen_37_part_10
MLGFHRPSKDRVPLPDFLSFPLDALTIGRWASCYHPY